jgi:hypothetical protein
MMQPAAPQVKTTTIRISNLRAGEYTVLSSDGATWYAVNVVRMSCTCKAGQTGFTNCRTDHMCRHLRVSKMLARVSHDRAVAARQPRPAPATNGAAGLMELYQ